MTRNKTFDAIITDIEVIHHANKIPSLEGEEVRNSGDMVNLVDRYEASRLVIKKELIKKDIPNRVLDLSEPIFDMETKMAVLTLLQNGSLNAAVLILSERYKLFKPKLF